MESSKSYSGSSLGRMNAVVTSNQNLPFDFIELSMDTARELDVRSLRKDFDSNRLILLVTTKVFYLKRATARISKVFVILWQYLLTLLVLL